jgi:Uma2 family endonuclease
MTLIEKMLHSPCLPQYLRTLEDILEDERERRRKFFEEVREDQKTEFINGKVIVHSPVAIEHNDVSVNLLILMRSHVDMHQLGFVGHEKLMVSLTRNDYEPDIVFFENAKSGEFKAGQMRFPAPDLVVEVLSRTTERTDRTIKFEDYAAHGTDEYWIVDPRKQTIEQYLLADAEYKLNAKAKDGNISSRALRGFVIPVRAAFEKKANLKALQSIVSA